MNSLYLLITLTIPIFSFDFNKYSHNFIKDSLKYYKNEHDITIFNNNILDCLRSRSYNKYNIISKKDDKLYTKNQFIKSYPKYVDNKIISISPGGLNGYYLVGIISYIKNNYDLSNYLFTGASAGAWSSLFMSHNGDNDKLIRNILNVDTSKIKRVFDLEMHLKNMMISKYHIENFDLDRLFVGVTVIKNLDFATNIFFNFDNLEDTLNCCIASSHIPFLTGGFINKYNNEISIDGGFSNYPYLDLNNTVLHINPQMWKDSEISKSCEIEDLFKDVSQFNFLNLFIKGYEDTEKNKDYLDTIFKKLN